MRSIHIFSDRAGFWCLLCLFVMTVPHAVAETGQSIIRRSSAGFIEFAQPLREPISPYGGRQAEVSNQSDDFVSIEPVYSFLTANEKFPYGGNDLAAWQGRGINGWVSGGASLSYGPLEAKAAPIAWTAQARSYDDYPHRRWIEDAKPYIDLTSNYTDRPVYQVDLGQSYVGVSKWQTRLRLSNERYWVGPGVRYTVLGTNNAPGYPHVLLGTDGPIETKLGTFEAAYDYGWTRESNEFSLNAPDDTTVINSLKLSYSFPFAPELTFGAARVIQAYWNDKEERDFWRMFLPFFKDELKTEDNPTGNDRSNQMLTVMLEYRSPDGNFRAYGEYARDDHADDLRILLVNPDHSRGYTVGFQYLFELGSVTGQLTFEHADLGFGQTGGIFANPWWYYHHKILQGYTNNGQLLGSQIGASNGQYLSLDLVRGPLELGLFTERVGTESALFYRYINDVNQRPLSFHRVSVQVTPGFRVAYEHGNYRFSTGLAIPIHFNRDFEADRDVRSLYGWLGVRYSLDQ